MATLVQTPHEAAISKWARDNSGVAVIWSNQNEPPPPKPYISLTQSDDDEVQGLGVGADEVQRHPLGIVKVAQHRRFGVSVQAWSNDVLGAGTARELLKNLRSTLNRADVQNTFIRAGVKPVATGGSVNDLTALLLTRGESRAQFDLDFAVVDVQTEDRGYIDTVNATVNVTTNGRETLPQITT